MKHARKTLPLLFVSMLLPWLVQAGDLTIEGSLTANEFICVNTNPENFVTFGKLDSIGHVVLRNGNVNVGVRGPWICLAGTNTTLNDKGSVLTFSGESGSIFGTFAGTRVARIGHGVHPNYLTTFYYPVDYSNQPPLNFNGSTLAGTGLAWNAATRKFDVSGPTNAATLAQSRVAGDFAGTETITPLRVNAKMFGKDAGLNASGNDWTAVGRYAGEGSTGNYWTAIGYRSGYQARGGAWGDMWTVLGPYAGYRAKGHDWYAIGTYAGQNAVGDWSMAIGWAAGQNARWTNSYAFGCYAGTAARGNERLYIDVYPEPPPAYGPDGSTNDMIFGDNGNLNLGRTGPYAGGKTNTLRGKWAMTDGSLLAGSNLSWNAVTRKLDAAVGGGAIPTLQQVVDAGGTLSNLVIGTGTASGEYALSQGFESVASGDYSYAGGFWTRADGWTSHAEGIDTIAGGPASHAEGDTSHASGGASHAEGNITWAVGDFSHAEGESTEAHGYASHAEGVETIARAEASHSGGMNTEVLLSHSNAFIHARGAWNNPKQTVYPDTAHFDKLYTFENWGANPPSHAVLNVAEMDVRYAGAVTGDQTIEGNLVVANNITQTGSSGTNSFMGKVGIGTNSPSESLHVAGKGRFEQGISYVARLGDISMGVYTNQ